MTTVIKEAAFKAVCKNHNNWNELSEELRTNRKFISRCIIEQGKIINFIHFDISDIDFVFELYLKNTKILIWLDKIFKNNFDFMIKCIKIKHEFFKFASKDLKNNRDFIIAALDIHPSIINSINGDFLIDETITVGFYAKYPHLIPTFVPFLMTDNFKLEILKRNGLALQFMNQYNIRHVYAALKQNFQIYPFLQDILKKDIKFIKYVLYNINGLVYQLISDEFKINKELIILALQNNPELLYELPPNQKYNYAHITIAYILKNNILDKQSFSLTFKRSYFKFAKAKVLEHKTLITFLCACSYQKHSERHIKRQRIGENILNKLNSHGPHFANILKENIYKYIHFNLKYLKLLKIVTQKEEKKRITC